MRLGATISLQDAVAHKFPIASVDLRPGMTDSELEAIRDGFKNANVLAAQAGAYYNLIATDDVAKTKAIEDVRKTLLAAEKIDCPFVVAGGGYRDPACPSSTFSAHRDNWSDEAIDLLADSCLKVLEQLPIRNTKLVLETWTMTSLNSPERAKRLYDKVNHPQFGILLDFVNLMNLDRYFRTGEFIRACVDILGDGIALIHLKDTLLKPEAFTYHIAETPIGKGNMDYPAVLSALNSLGKQDLILMVEHCTTIEEYVESSRYVRQTAKQIGIDLV